MSIYIALLSSITTLAPGRRVVMADLRSMAERLGLQTPRTMIATGNLLFEAKATAAARLEKQLETEFEKTFGKHIDIIVRSEADWRKMIVSNPFPKESKTDADHVVVRVMRKPVRDGMVAALEPYLANGERTRLIGADPWIHFARDIGHSKLAAAMTIKRIGIGTMRNWNTVRGLGDMLG